ncbi:hypothetical protein DFH05DRAFT_1520590 [Lentinula detonsa]|uniref:Uncharacterized protein n=1 Tax=Lentinula detonsa TaxID=2804962 RepID=A0A9W8U1S5_9AGAR|nr:hypothetical protein DFH05DRAFT_1520590 [Lentinula detonsa]
MYSNNRDQRYYPERGDRDSIAFNSDSGHCVQFTQTQYRPTQYTPAAHHNGTPRPASSPYQQIDTRQESAQQRFAFVSPFQSPYIGSTAAGSASRPFNILRPSSALHLPIGPAFHNGNNGHQQAQSSPFHAFPQPTSILPPSRVPSRLSSSVLGNSGLHNLPSQNARSMETGDGTREKGTGVAAAPRSQTTVATGSLQFINSSAPHTVDAQQLELESAQARAAAARTPIPAPTPIQTRPFLGRTSPAANRTMSSLSALLNSPTRSDHDIESFQSSPRAFPELPLSPLRPTIPDSSTCGSEDHNGDFSILFNSSSNDIFGDGGAANSESREAVPVIRPRMGAAERRVKNSTKDTGLSEAVQALADYTDTEVKRIAAEYKKPILSVKKLIGVHRRFREKKTSSLYNALMHRKSQQLRLQAIPFGPSMKEKHRAMANDDDIQVILANPDCDEALEALNELSEYQVAKISGARVSAKANDNDIVKTWAELTRKAENMSKRTSAATFGFVCSSKSGQNLTRQFFGNGPIEGFLISKFGMTGAEFVEAVESYCILTSTGRTATGMGVKSMQKEITKLILEGLRNITRNDKVGMEYEHYEVLLVKEYGVQLTGWPDNVPLTSAHNLHSANVITLYQAIKTKQCKWMKLGGRELHRVRKDIEARIKSGDLLVPERNRGKKRRAVTDTEGGQKKKRKVGGRESRKSAGNGKSRRVRKEDRPQTTSSDDEGEEEEEWGVAAGRPRPKPKLIRKVAQRVITSEDEEDEGEGEDDGYQGKSPMNDNDNVEEDEDEHSHVRTLDGDLFDFEDLDMDGHGAGSGKDCDFGNDNEEEEVDELTDDA